jgi:hypothetical protein
MSVGDPHYHLQAGKDKPYPLGAAYDAVTHIR